MNISGFTCSLKEYLKRSSELSYIQYNLMKYDNENIAKNGLTVRLGKSLITIGVKDSSIIFLFRINGNRGYIHDKSRHVQ